MSANHASRFTVEFDGPAVKDGTMEVRELAPALLALGVLCERVNALLNPDSVRVAVRVEAQIQAGSFDVSFLFDQSLGDHLKELFGQEKIHAANELLHFLGIGGVIGAEVGLVKLLKFLRCKSLKELPTDKSGTVTVNINNSTLIVPPEVLKLAGDPQVRHGVQQLVAPVEKEGINEIRFVQQKRVVETIAKEDVPALRMPRDMILEAERGPHELENVLTLELITPQFDPHLKWRLQSQDLRMTGLMRDEAFLARVQEREIQFGQGDVMTVRVKSVQTISPQGKPTIENAIMEVLDYRPAAIQLHLSGKGSSDDETC